MSTAIKSLILSGFILTLSACKDGGVVTFEPGAKKSVRGLSYAQVNQGGKALIVENGKTPTTGVHGWIAVQSVSGGNLQDAGQNTLIINKPGH